MKVFFVRILCQLIENNIKERNISSQAFMGYKLFSKLMNDPKFASEVANSALSTTKRKYRNKNYVR